MRIFSIHSDMATWWYCATVSEGATVAASCARGPGRPRGGGCSTRRGRNATRLTTICPQKHRTNICHLVRLLWMAHRSDLSFVYIQLHIQVPLIIPIIRIETPKMLARGWRWVRLKLIMESIQLISPAVGGRLERAYSSLSFYVEDTRCSKMSYPKYEP